jgi:hypothetical protein
MTADAEVPRLHTAISRLVVDGDGDAEAVEGPENRIETRCRRPLVADWSTSTARTTSSSV